MILGESHRAVNIGVLLDTARRVTFVQNIYQGVAVEADGQPVLRLRGGVARQQVDSPYP